MGIFVIFFDSTYIHPDADSFICLLREHGVLPVHSILYDGIPLIKIDKTKRRNET